MKHKRQTKVYQGISNVMADHRELTKPGDP